MPSKNYSDLERAEIVIHFEDILQSREARQYRDKVKHSLEATIKHYSEITVGWATILRWYVMAKTDRTSGVNQYYRHLKEGTEVSLKSAV